MTTAKFTIDSDASTPPGYDATTSQVLTLQLEDLPALDVWSVLFEVSQSSKDAPALVFSPVTGIPTTPGGSVDVTMPGSGAHSYVITCTINGGRNASGTVVAAYTYSRLVAIKTAAGLRKITPAERTEYDETYGWAGAQNDMVDGFTGSGLSYGGAPPDVAAASAAGVATTPSRSDHTHGHGAQTDGTMHAAVIASGASGFMTGTDKAKLDAATADDTAAVIMKRDDSRATGLSGITVRHQDPWVHAHVQHASGAGETDSW